MAGESARESARRQRAKAERLLRSAELWERGADGETATAQVLQMLPVGWVVLHDLRWPGRRYANIDHVVIGPPGVFVVDSKNWSGRIDVRHDVLRQNGRQREKAVAGAADSALALAEQLTRIDASRVYPVLCFVQDEPLTGWARDVMVCSTQNLVAMLTTRPPSFVPMRVTGITTEVQAAGRRMTSGGPAGARSNRPARTARGSTPLAAVPAPARRTGRRRRAPGVLLPLLLVCSLLVFREQAAELLSRLFVPSTIAEESGPCDELRATYPSGVGRKDARDSVASGERRVTTYAVRPKLYRQHRALDADGDGIACETP